MPTHYKGTPRDTQMLNTFISLHRAITWLDRALRARLEEEGISERHFAILEALFHLGALEQKTLASKLLCSPGNMTLALKHLEVEGLVSRKDRREDRRCHSVSLTPKGHALIKRIFPRHLDAMRTCFDALSNEDLHQLHRITRKLGTTLAARAII